MTDAPRTMAERIVESYAAAWMPKEGQYLSGFISEITTGKSEHGDYPLVTITKEDGTRLAVHAFHTVLRDRLIEMRPTIGEEIAIMYLGRTLPKHYVPTGKMVKATLAEQLKGDGYENYRVIVNRTPVDIWGRFTKATARGTDQTN